MPAFLAVAPLITTALSAAFSGYQAAHQNSKQKRAEAEARRQLANSPVYKTPESIKNLLADTMSQRNAVNPALLMAYQQAQQAAAAQEANARRSATSGAEALAAGSAAQNNLQSIVPTLANMQSAYAQQNKNAYYGALGNMAEDDRFKFQDASQRNADQFNFALGQAGAANAGKWQGINNAVSSINTLANTLGNPQYMSYLKTGQLPSNGVPIAKTGIAGGVVGNPYLASAIQKKTVPVSNNMTLPTSNPWDNWNYKWTMGYGNIPQG